MEQSRRQWGIRAALIAAVLVTAAALGTMCTRRPAEDRVAGHAFAIPTTENRIVIEVFNATSRQGLARRATRLLRGRGLDVVYLGNADAPLDSSRVVVRRGDPARAHQVAAALGITRVASEPDTLRRVDVSVYLGQDFRPELPLHP